MRKTHLRTRPERTSRGGRSRSLPPITQPHGSQADRSNVSQLAASAVALRDVRKVYGEGESAVVALDGRVRAWVVHGDHGAVGLG
jgi:hypothetical protein